MSIAILYLRYHAYHGILLSIKIQIQKITMDVTIDTY